jgi:16S rRNA (cytosine1402-N4)-methyltransferase
MKTNSPHRPVLLDEVITHFSNITDTFIDATLGYGGHSEALLEHNPSMKHIGIDQDSEAIAFSTQRLAPFGERVTVIKNRFSAGVKEVLQTHADIEAILADIGVSSLQLDKLERGFGFESDVLDMRMDSDAAISAFDIVNFYSKEKLTKIFKVYGEVNNAAQVAAAILQARTSKTIDSAKELAEIVLRVSRRGKKKIHPATLVFQAIRIEVNQELQELEALLDAFETYAKVGTKLGIITFHSLEDRIVKQRFKQWSVSCICPPEAFKCTCGNDHNIGKTITRKAVVASAKEISENSRSRSAKLRVFIRE